MADRDRSLPRREDLPHARPPDKDHPPAPPDFPAHAAPAHVPTGEEVPAPPHTEGVQFQAHREPGQPPYGDLVDMGTAPAEIRPAGPHAEGVQHFALDPAPDPARVLGEGAPRLAPLPQRGAPQVPPYQPFAYTEAQPLTARDLDVISTFHATYMQGQGIGQDWQRFRQAQRDAAIVLPLMQKQYHLACQGVGNEKSQEAQQIKRNVEWVDQLLKLEE